MTCHVITYDKKRLGNPGLLCASVRSWGLAWRRGARGQKCHHPKLKHVFILGLHKKKNHQQKGTDLSLGHCNEPPGAVAFSMLWPEPIVP
jgi:hypothetical protein